MASVIPERMSAKVDGDFVVFLIGMRVNKLWKVHKWLPVFLAMPKMLRELKDNPSSGLLGVESAGLTIIQYWRSFDALEAYARSRDGLHWPAWMAFNKRMARSRGDVGIWHETYKIAAGQYEAIYSGMPARGLGKVSQLLSAEGARDTARGRIGA
jgi:Domain of unknown function (DUF4188)